MLPGMLTNTVDGAPITTQQTPPPDGEHRFAFHGTGSAFFALMLKNMVVTMITLGIYGPWAKTAKRAFLWQNIEIKGSRLRYHGTGEELFVGYLKVFAAYMVFIAVPQLLGLVLGKTVGVILQVLFALALLPLIPMAIWGSRRYLLSRTSWRGVRFRLEGNALEFGKVLVGGYLLTIVTLGIYAPIWMNRIHKTMMNATALGTQRFEYRGEDKVVWLMGIKAFFLSLLTLGIYWFWYRAELSRYQMQNTFFSGARADISLTGGDLFKLTMLQLFGVTLTLGIAFPWITCYSLRYMLDRMRLVGPIDFAHIYQADAQGNATQDGLADMLDVGLEI
jgi:uncharacterized membrane protein YjgN (DUF898 family)